MSPEVDGEHAIVRRIQAGNHDEYRFLVDRYKDEMVALAYRQVGDHGIAEDLAQDTFVRAYSSLSKFRFESTFRTWLIRIALNVTRSYFSSREFSERSQNTLFEQEAYERFLAPASSGSAHEDLELLRHALQKIESKFREAVLLVLVQGWSYEEAAVLLGVPVGTVSSRVTTGLARLKAHIERRSA